MADLTLDEVFKQAIVEHFFGEPLPHLVPGADGQMLPIMTRPNPMRVLVDQIVARNQEDLIKRVFERIDIDDLADKLAEKLTARFAGELDMANTMKSTWNPYHPSTWMKDVDDMAKRIVAAELADKMMATLEPTPEESTA